MRVKQPSDHRDTADLLLFFFFFITEFNSGSIKELMQSLIPVDLNEIIKNRLLQMWLAYIYVVYLPVSAVHSSTIKSDALSLLSSKKKNKNKQLWDYSGLFGLHTDNKNFGCPDNNKIKTDVYLT